METDIVLATGLISRGGTAMLLLSGRLVRVSNSFAVEVMCCLRMTCRCSPMLLRGMLGKWLSFDESISVESV